MVDHDTYIDVKIAVNTRIVVIGGSDTGIAFLERLAYVRSLHPRHRLPLMLISRVTLELAFMVHELDSNQHRKHAHCG